jgi:hypothetical protein
MPFMLIGAAVGAAAGGISTWLQGEQNRKRAREERDRLQRAYEYGARYKNGVYNLQKDNALETLGIQKNRLAEAPGADVEGFNLGLKGQALDNRDARISLADSTGEALAQRGGSGVRGIDTLERRVKYAEDTFNARTDLQQQSNSLAMRNMARQYSYQFNDIGREIDSWHPGGYRQETKRLGDIYDLQMHGLQMERAEDAIDDATPGLFDYATGILGGAYQGAQFGMGIDSLLEQMKGREAAEKIADAVAGPGTGSNAAKPAGLTETLDPGYDTPRGNTVPAETNSGITLPPGGGRASDVYAYYSRTQKTGSSLEYLRSIGLTEDQVTMFDRRMGEFNRNRDPEGRRVFTRDFLKQYLGWDW